MNRRFRYGTRCAAVALLLLAGSVLVWAWQWPHEEARVVAGFGQAMEEAFLVGLKVVASDQEVRPVEVGELVFRSRPAHLPELLPSTLGGVVALEHGRSFRSLYGHLEPNLTNRDTTHFGLEDSVGRFGPYGFSTGTSLHLEIYDLEQDLRVNPLLLLPRRDKTTRPTVQAVVLRSVGDSAEGRSGQPVPVPGAAVTLPAGRWELELQSHDLVAPGTGRGAPTRVAPHSYTVRVNGEERFRLVHDTANVRDGSLRLSGRRSYHEFYGESAFIRLNTLELSDEPLQVLVEVRDHVGNVAQRSIRVVPAGF